MTLTEDTLQKFGESFQNKSISTLLIDDKFAETTIELIKEEFFESELNKWIVKNIKEYYEKFGTTPTLESISLMAKKEFDDSIRQKIYLDHLKNIFELMKSKDLEYIKEQFKEFCKNQNMKTAIIKSVDLLKIGKYTDIQSIMNNALNAGEEQSIGHFYKDDFDKRMERELRTTVSTGLEELDETTGGGLAAGELGCIVAPSGAGKSWFLAHLGLAAMRQGVYVSHYTLELNDFYTAHRYDTILTGIELQHLHDDGNKETINNSIDGIKGNLLITKYPTKFASPFTILNHQKRLKNLGIRVGLIIIDYADLLSSTSTSKNENSYETGGTIYEQLRGIAGELNVPLWTASQAGRAAISEDIVEANNISESYKKVMTSDLVISASRKRDDKVNNTGRIHIIKNRFGRDGHTYNAVIDTSIGKIEILGESTGDGVNKNSLDKVKNLLNTNNNSSNSFNSNNILNKIKNSF